MAALYEKHGINREDRAAMLVLDRLEFPIIFWGSLKCGVVPIALNTLLATEVYGSIFVTAEPEYCLCPKKSYR